jgi:threonine dehydratase
MITLEDVRAAAARIEGRVLRTPALRSDAISRATGADVTLKLENLQATGAFKERGAANRLALLTAEERRAGVIAMSAGNHAQAVARHAHLLGITAVIVMPTTTPLSLGRAGRAGGGHAGGIRRPRPGAVPRRGAGVRASL